MDKTFQTHAYANAPRYGFNMPHAVQPNTPMPLRCFDIRFPCSVKWHEKQLVKGDGRSKEDRCQCSLQGLQRFLAKLQLKIAPC